MPNRVPKGAIVVSVQQTRASVLADLGKAAETYAEAQIAQSTRHAYDCAWGRFTEWCASVGVAALPVEPDTLALYLTAAARSLSVATLNVHIAAIGWKHRGAGYAAPDGGMLNAVWQGICRTHGRPPLKKRALITRDLRRVVAKMPASLSGVRDRAIVLIGFSAALRRSELAKLSLNGANAGTVVAQFTPDGLEIHITRSKDDPYGNGAILAVPFGGDLCPVTALQAWLSAANISSGPLFRGIDRHGNIGRAAISDKAIADIVKRSVARANLDPTKYAGHSLRSGLITSAARAGAASDVLQRHARHARYDTTMSYIQDAERFGRGNAVRKVGL